VLIVQRQQVLYPGTDLWRRFTRQRRAGADIHEHATVLLEIAWVCPGKWRRWQRLVKTDSHLFSRCQKLIGPWDEANIADVLG